jgi:hypothetical protein
MNYLIVLWKVECCGLRKLERERHVFYLNYADAFEDPRCPLCGAMELPAPETPRSLRHECLVASLEKPHRNPLSLPQQRMRLAA